MQIGNSLTDRQDPQAAFEHRPFLKRTRKLLTVAAAFRDGATNMAPMRPQDGPMRAALQHNDSKVILERLDDPGCVGLVRRLYMEGITIAMDKCRLTTFFANFTFGRGPTGR